ncbi:MAG TPA: ribbon-helix-helix protein, CopG family [Solirubrobacterales bacterium]|nr:ribbon-helix-helix protein, CopG family [Solirubrobacterales bacterium]
MSKGKRRPTKATSLRLSPEVAAELEAVARALGMTISDVVRAAVSNHIASVRSDDRFQARLREQMEKDRELLERLAE